MGETMARGKTSQFVKERMNDKILEIMPDVENDNCEECQACEAYQLEHVSVNCPDHRK